ncbi:lipoprotein [Nocardioides marinquilinus]|uniref:Lipoprotein n=1 Tax=Nocardioides marinquilinus TaxID=1210400 RepID=A0ABP9P752_9ACTN
MPTRLAAVPALALATSLAVAGCGADEPPASSAPPDGPAASASDDHGEVAGAVEVDEPPLGLTTIDRAGVVRHLDLLDETATDLADLGRARAVHTDGRFVFAQTPRGVEVVDSGVWTWDHVDHFHYYRAEPRQVGRVVGRGPVTVATTSSSTSGGSGLFFGSGEAVMLDTGALADGEVVERYRLDVAPHDGMLVPVGDAALLTEPGPTGRAARVVVLDAEGRPTGEEHPCRHAASTVTTRVGAVVGCADGALLATVEDDVLQVRRIDLPPRADAPAPTSFAGRDGRPTVAGLADAGRVWLLDTREESWRLLDAPVPLAQVTAVDDDDEHVVGLTTDGRVAVIDGGSGDLLATTGPLAGRSLRDGVGVPTLVVDQQRAYLSAPAERRLHEIDFADDARVARTFRTPTPPLLLAGTGR